MEAELRAEVRTVDRVWPNAPKAAAFLPLVLLLAVALPWIHLLAHARMHSDLAVSGLRALDLLYGQDETPGEPTELAVPPLPVWVHAVALSLPTKDKSLAVAAPAALFGILSVLVIYRLGAVWFSPAVGILSASLLVCNRTFLEQIRGGDPGTLVLFFTLASLWAFAEHVDRQDDVFSRWTLVGGFAMAGLFLTAGAYALSMGLLGLAAMFFRGGDDDESLFERVRRSAADPTTRAGFITLLFGAAIAAPWLASAHWRWGAWFPWDSPQATSTEPLGWWDVVAAGPALVVLACFGFIQSIRNLLHRSPQSGREAMPAIWTLLAALAFKFVAPTSAAILVLSAPMFLLASRTILAVLDRKLPDRAVLWLAAISVTVFALQLALGSTGPRDSFQDWRALGIGFLGVAFSLTVLTALFRWTRDSDSRRRVLFGALVVSVIALASAPGAMLLRSKPRSEDPWRQIQQRFESLVRSENPDAIVLWEADLADVVLREDPRPVVEFLVRTSAPKKERLFAANQEGLERKLFASERPLLVVVESTRPLPKIHSFAQGLQTLTLTERFDATVQAAGDRRELRVAIYSPLGPRSAE